METHNKILHFSHGPIAGSPVSLLPAILHPIPSSPYHILWYSPEFPGVTTSSSWLSSLTTRAGTQMHPSRSPSVPLQDNHAATGQSKEVFCWPCSGHEAETYCSWSWPKLWAWNGASAPIPAQSTAGHEARLQSTTSSCNSQLRNDSLSTLLGNLSGRTHCSLLVLGLG